MICRRGSFEIREHNIAIRARANAESSTLEFLSTQKSCLHSSLSYEAFAMSASKSGSRKRASESERAKSDKNKRSATDNFDLDLDFDLSDDIKGIVSALHLIRDKAQKDGQKKNEETISSVGSEVKSMIEGLRSKIEKDRQSFAKALSKSSKEYESSLKNETAKFQAFHENFCKEKATSLQALKDIISKFEEEKEKLFVRYEQLRKKERVMISEQEKACNHKIAQLEDSLRKKKQDDKTFSILRKTLGSFLESTSDEDFPPDD
ncbi:hypothetical protein JHK82_019244 [Glycine max]|uniref:DNA ligase 1 n=2 Tax=Glycine soja TaxID=3848 RepID=A0A445JZD0_GLYSO|nr:DNA ligase 1-like [Glycine soja]KAG5023340.1 hypothetical protein JHK85_019682 [Glycine max]KAG5038421.1 hypothetical protein JHK86_019261 [Glycine max]KAG5143549.1 hypothetical protein JHK82_019244 [Glycine max]KAH1087636.1 hypothetical protein GYH30_018955 [Glycine max]KAH1242973.1 hypothetical protein GmHk_07G020163 [Glycine max]